MIFEQLPLEAAFVVGLEPRKDERGSFARAFCQQEFEAHGLESNLVQANLCTNNQRGIVRGMHFQRAPYSEVKLVRCIRGSIFDVIVDIRERSPTYGHWTGVEISETNGKMIYVPKGFAHGYQTLCEDTVVFYLVTTAYQPDAEGGLRHDDPSLGIEWPLPITDVSVKDRHWPPMSA